MLAWQRVGTACLVLLFAGSPCFAQRPWTIDTVQVPFPYPHSAPRATIAADSGAPGQVSVACRSANDRLVQAELVPPGSPFSTPEGLLTSVAVRFDGGPPTVGNLMVLDDTALFVDGMQAQGVVGVTWLAERMAASGSVWLDLNTRDGSRHTHFTLRGNTRTALAHVFTACHRTPAWR